MEVLSSFLHSFQTSTSCIKIDNCSSFAMLTFHQPPPASPCRGRCLVRPTTKFDYFLFHSNSSFTFPRSGEGRDGGHPTPASTDSRGSNAECRPRSSSADFNCASSASHQ